MEQDAAADSSVTDEHESQASWSMDAWTVLKGLYWRRLSAIVLGVLTVLGLVDTLAENFWSMKTQNAVLVRHHLPRLTGWEWVALVAVGVIVVGFVGTVSMYREGRSDLAAAAEASASERRLMETAHSEEIKALREEPVGEPHRDKIRRIAQSVADSIASGMPCKYADPISPVVGPDYRAALEVHCPDVIGPCDKWDAKVRDVNESAQRLRRLVHAKVEEAFSEPPWMQNAVEDVVFERLMSYVNATASSDPPAPLSDFTLTAIHYSGPQTDNEIYVNGRHVLHREGLSEEEVAEAQAKINDSMVSFSDTMEFVMLQADNHLKEVYRPLARVAALQVGERHSLPYNDGCPLC